MAGRSILQANIETRGMVLDPRTKLLLLLTMAIFVLGGAGGESLSAVTPVLCAAPLVLQLTAKKWRTAALYLLLYCTACGASVFLLPHVKGLPGFLLLALCGIMGRFLPSIMMGVYVFSTTTVSEFTAAMQRMHVTEKLSIPLSVMFRFFPTVAEEFHAINAAMRMRGITFGGRNWTKMLEYRMIPLLTCSVQIGGELSAAALARGLGGEVRRTNVCRIGFHLQDMTALFLCTIPYVLLALRFLEVIE